MSNNKLIEFLENHSPFKEESEIVYLLAEIRKIIEGYEGKYNALKFYCNWALHSKLDKKSTIRILSSKLDKFIDFSKDRNEIQKMISDADKGRFMKMEDFRLELIDFLKKHTLSIKNFDGNKWDKFRELYLEIIYKCPIIQNSSGISGLSLIKTTDGYYYEFYIIKSVRIPKIKLKFKRK